MNARLAVLACTLALVAAACGGDGSETDTGDTQAPTTNQTINGLVTVPVDASGTAGEPCDASSGEFSDVAEGATVTVSDETGAELGAGQVASGTYADTADPACEFPFSVLDVVPSTSYVISIGDRALGTFTQAQIGGLVEITLG